MSTKRQLILASAKTLLESASGMQYVEITKANLPDFDGKPYPCAYVAIPTESRNTDEYALMGKENWKGELLVEVWVDGKSDIEVVLGAVKAVLSVNNRFGGNACFSAITKVEQFIIDPLKERQGMFLHYDIWYFNTPGTP